jgi:hypothetical protein
VFIDASPEFPWDTQRSLELAFYRAYAVPSIATLLDSTGEFTQRAEARLATFWFWREVGKRMAIRHIPESYDEFCGSKLIEPGSKSEPG